LKRHLKTYPAPRFWPILIKEHEFTIRPASGPHQISWSIPLGILLRDILKYAKTVREVKRILAEGKVLIDGKVRADYKFPVGLMDVVYLKPAKEYYRVLPNSTNRLALVKITPEEATFKLVRLTGKRTLRGNKVQLNFHDGRSSVARVEDPFNLQMGYRIFDVLKISLPDGQVIDSIPLEPDAFVSIIGGTNIGSYGTLKETPEMRGPNKLARVMIGDVENTVTLKYLFPIGKGSPIINISGAVT
jgi:small subunit ribosomal protein S4e